MRGQRRERREGVCNKGFLQREIRISPLQRIHAFALTLYGISEQLCYLQAGTKHSVLALFQITPKSWNRPEKKNPNEKSQQQQNSFFPLLPSQFCLFSFFSFSTQRDIFLGIFFFKKSSGLKILGHLGILGASGRSRAEHREVLGRPQRGEGCAGACAERKEGGKLRGGKRGHIHF